MKQASMQISYLDLCSPRIQKEKRILILADLHEQPGARWLSDWTALQPDAVLIVGDFIEHEDKRGHRRETLSLITSLCRLCPVFYALGNHEMGYRGNRRPSGEQGSRATRAWDDETDGIVQSLRECGAWVLNNEFVFHDGLCIGALTPAGDGLLDTGWIDDMAKQKEFRLLLCHHPEYYPSFVQRYGLDLTVSGHAHGGQWRLLGRGVYAPGQGLFPKLTGGFYDDGRLLVSRGLADRFVVPRIGNKKQTILLHLKPIQR